MATVLRSWFLLLVVVSCSLAGCSGDDGPDGVGEAPGDVVEGADEQVCGADAPPCAANEYCDFADDQCGDVAVSGVCRPRPDGCDDVFEPACGCDSVEYENACSAAAAGADVGGLDCVSDRSFACGDVECAAGEEYCEEFVPGVPGGSTSYSCPALPGECAVPSCDCFDGPACDCEQDEQGDIRVTCYAP